MRLLLLGRIMPERIVVIVVCCSFGENVGIGFVDAVEVRLSWLSLIVEVRLGHWRGSDGLLRLGDLVAVKVAILIVEFRLGHWLIDLTNPFLQTSRIFRTKITTKWSEILIACRFAGTADIPDFLIVMGISFPELLA